MQLLGNHEHRDLIAELARSGGEGVDLASAGLSLFGMNALLDAKALPEKLRLLLDIDRMSKLLDTSR